MPPPETIESSAAPRGIDETLEAYVIRLARLKGQFVASQGVFDTVLACDTLGEIDGILLGKPADREDARRMLSALSGRTHRVLTGVWLHAGPARPGESPRTVEAVEESLLEMGPLEGPLLDWYLDSGMWRGKAGACGFQDEKLPLRLLSGTGSNVMGLPLERIQTLLEEFDRLAHGPGNGPSTTA